jgi:hypothetical protein
MDIVGVTRPEPLDDMPLARYAARLHVRDNAETAEMQVRTPILGGEQRVSATVMLRVRI